jgi:hypothetical protein
MMSVHFGRDAKLYYNSATYITPTWVEIATVRDVAIPDGEREQIDATGRDSPVRTYEPGHLTLSVEFKIRTNESDTPFTFLEAAALALPTAVAAMLDIMILTGPQATNGNRGFRFDSKIHKFFGEDQNIDQLLWRSVILKPCVPTNPVKSVVVTGAVPVFTTFAG